MRSTRIGRPKRSRITTSTVSLFSDAGAAPARGGIGAPLVSTLAMRGGCAGAAASVDRSASISS